MGFSFDDERNVMLQRAMRACGQRFGLPTLLLGYLLLLCFATPGFAMPTGAGKATTQTSASSTQVELEGELEVLHEDDFKNKKSRTRHFLKTGAGERYELKFSQRVAHYQSGSKVRVRGSKSGNLLALDTSTESSIQILAAAYNNPLGEQKTAVILLNFQDDQSQPVTPAQVQSLVFGTVNNFFKENSHQQTWLNGTVFGWYTAPASKTCDMTAVETYAKQAASAAGADLSGYTRFVYMFPRNTACSWAGLAANTSSAWINGYFEWKVVAHELGHNLGLNHAHALDCDTGSLTGNCTVFEYGDTADIMGSRPGHINAFEKESLGWLNSSVTPPIITVQESGSYRLDPYETSSNNPKALKIIKSIDPTTGIKKWYYLEYRQPIGFDSVLNGVGNLVSGIQVRIADEVTAINMGSYLLDMTPNSHPPLSVPDMEDSALAVGQSFTDTATGLTFTTSWADASGAGVDVSFAKSTCTLGKPSLLVSPLQSAAVAAGTPVSYTVAVTNNDSSACPAASLNLQASLPSGWVGQWTSTSISLAPGNSASTTLTVTSPSTAISGSYTIGVTATNSANTSYSNTGAAAYSITASSLATTVMTDKASYLRGDTVTITGTATKGGLPLGNTNISFAVIKPNGGTTTASAATDANGKAVYRLRLNKQKDPAGIYQVSDTVISNGQSTKASTSFSAK
ncbi:NEW3 domain-containing protein [Vogesella indigofera]|uniref:NEW3 domain-containing protein n=1 Tax=Vogesella indigofera TaxID=45465 RepID=UPI00234E7347|nr:NEW3 domain-containing protein [Vogesella indigofera]MDC7696300.1 NEW3 domain-containing protein [Vogesella indigofera]